MNTAKEHDNSDLPIQSRTPFYSLSILSNVSSSAQLLYIKLRNMAGCNGYISKPVRELKYLTGKCDRQTRRLIRELESSKLIEIWTHQGFENEIIITDVYFRHTLDKKVRTFKSKINTKLTVREPASPDGISFEHQESNPVAPAGIDAKTSIHQQKVKSDFHTDTIVTESSPKSIHNKPKNPVNFQLVKEIINLTNDPKSVRCWVKFVRSAPEQIVQLAIHSLKSALQCETVYHAGKYLIGIIRRIFPEMFNSGHKQPVRQPQHIVDASFYPKVAVEPPDIERNEELNLSSIQAIRALLAAKESLCSVG